MPSFAAMLVAAAVLVPIAAWGLSTDRGVPQEDVTAHLLRFLSEGPSEGLWEAERRSGRRRAYFAPMPGDPTRVLMAPAPRGDAASFCETCRDPCSYTPAQVMRFFFEAPSSLFARNYVQEGGLEPGRLRTGEEALVARFVARRLARGGSEPMLAGRDVWLDRETRQVLQIEDHTRSGHPIRIVWRVTADTGDWDPASFDPATDPTCGAPCPSCVSAAEQLEVVQADAPFAIVAPTALPAGFELIRARYHEVPVPLGSSASDVESDDDQVVVPARVASLLYSDGLALLSIAMAPPTEMDALEALYARMRAARDQDRPDVGSTACPTLPPAEMARVVSRSSSGDVVRWRQDVCRTVARRDGVSGLSVTLLGRNELSGDDYLDILMSVAPLDGP